MALLSNLVQQNNIAQNAVGDNSGAGSLVELCKSTRLLKSFLDMQGSQNCASARILSKQITPASIDNEQVLRSTYAANRRKPGAKRRLKATCHMEANMQFIPHLSQALDMLSTKTAMECENQNQVEEMKTSTSAKPASLASKFAKRQPVA